MNHVEFDILLHLAECIEEGVPFDESETELMRHIAECEQCYKAFCGLIAVTSVTSDAGYVALSDIYATKESEISKEDNSCKTLNVISVVISRINEVVSVLMEQVDRAKDSFNFFTPLVSASRTIADQNGPSGAVLEDIKNANNYFMIDSERKVLLVQFDAKDFDDEKTAVSIIFDNGKKETIPFLRKGNVFVGKIVNLPDERFELIIEKK